MSRYVVQDMTESARPRAAEQPRKTTLSAGGPETRATLLWVSLFLASGSCGCSTVRVDRRPSTRHQQSRQGTTRAARMFTAESRRIAIETASVLRTSDALPQNCSNGSKGMLFSVDRLFHRRSCIVDNRGMMLHAFVSRIGTRSRLLRTHFSRDWPETFRNRGTYLSITVSTIIFIAFHFDTDKCHR